MKGFIKFILMAAAVLTIAAAATEFMRRRSERAAIDEYDGEAMFIG